MSMSRKNQPRIFSVIFLYLVTGIASADRLIPEITTAGEVKSPLAVVPFAWQGLGVPPSEDIAGVIEANLFLISYSIRGKHQHLSPLTQFFCLLINV